MKDRIKKIRKELDLTQQDFADRLRIKRNTVASYETGKSNLSDGAISLICREFNVNEEWLRTGNGEMFIEISKENQLMQWSAEILKDESDSFKRRFVSMLMSLDESDWKTLEKIAQQLYNEKS